MMKFIPLLMIIAVLVGCDGSGSNGGGGSTGGNERGNVDERPHNPSEADYMISIIEYAAEDVLRSEVRAYRGFPMEFFLMGTYTDGDYEIKSAEGCGGVRRVEEADYYWETINNVPGNCTVEIHYESTQTDLPHLVRVDSSGYGATIEPSLLSVPDGEPAHIFIDAQDGYSVSMSGCGGQQLDDRYLINSVGEDCTVHATVTPTSGQQVAITTSATLGARIQPESAIVNAGDTVRFNIQSGFGFESTVTGCDGVLAEGVYEFTASSDCAINVEAQPVQDVPIVSVETTQGEPVVLKVYLSGDEPSVYNSVPEMAVLENVEGFYVEQRRPNSSIITSFNGCSEDNYGGLQNIYSGVSIFPGESDCTLTLTTEPSSYTQFGRSYQYYDPADDTFKIEPYTNEQMAFTGTASQFSLAEIDPEFKVAEVTGHYLCDVQRNGDIVTLNHPQQILSLAPELYGIPELCWSSVYLQPKDYVDPWDDYENQWD